MAVVNVTPKWSGSSGHADEDGRTSTRVYTVLTDDPENDDDVVVRQASGIPRVKDDHPTDPWMKVTGVDPTRVTLTLWDVTVTYEAGAGPDESDNPLEEPVEIEWMGQVSRVKVEQDVEGNLIQNAAEERFDPPIEADVYDTLIRFGRNEPSFNEAQADEYRGAINSDPFRGRVPGQCRLVVYDGKEMWQGNFKYARVTYEVAIRTGIDPQPDGSGGPEKAWWRRILNEGFRAVTVNDLGLPIKDPQTERVEYTRIRDSHGQLLTEPEMLNAEGEKLKLDEPAVFLEFQMSKKLPFSVLGLE